MKSFGTILREAREARGLTPSQVANDTHMLPQTVEEMEREDFHRIPAAIYGRGFVRLYAERVGIDPNPLIDLFMDLYSGKKRSMQSDSPSVPHPQPSDATGADPAAEPAFPSSQPSSTTPNAPTDQGPAPEPAPSAEVPPALRGLDLFDQSSRPVVPPAAPVPPPNTPHVDSPWASTYARDDDRESLPEGSAAERFRAGFSSVSHGVLGTVRDIPRRTFRIALVVCGVLALAGLCVWGCVALYHATAITGSEPAVKFAPNTTQSATSPNAPSKLMDEKKSGALHKSAPIPASDTLKSTGPSVPPLYLD